MKSFSESLSKYQYIFLLQVILLDSSLSGWDAGTRLALRQLLNALKVEIGNGDCNRVILATCSNYDESEFFGDRLALLSSGRVLAHDTPGAIRFAFGAGYEIIVQSLDKLLLCMPSVSIAFLSDILIFIKCQKIFFDINNQPSKIPNLPR